MQAVWSACESCMRACLATHRLACDTKRVQRAQIARCRARARPPSSPRPDVGVMNIFMNARSCTVDYEARILSKSRYEPRLRAIPPKRVVYEPRALSSVRKTNARSILPAVQVFRTGSRSMHNGDRRLNRRRPDTCLRSRLRMRSACHAKPRNGARLRARFANIFGKANRCLV